MITTHGTSSAIDYNIGAQSGSDLVSSEIASAAKHVSNSPEAHRDIFILRAAQAIAGGDDELEDIIADRIRAQVR